VFEALCHAPLMDATGLFFDILTLFALPGLTSGLDGRASNK
jgi:hypothetical protein